jgi:hypothetical protein
MNSEADTLTAPAPAVELNPEQAEAVEAILHWLSAPWTENNWAFILSGSAGTGKTFCVRRLPELASTYRRFVYTAPTNKAVRELRASVSTPKYKPTCRTTYSLLGLRIMPNGEVKELAEPEDPVDLSRVDVVIVDEGSMVNKILLNSLEKAAVDFKLKVLFMGDSAQLPPVGLPTSPIWLLNLPPGTQRVALTQVMRYDNQILRLATDLRDQQRNLVPMFRPVEDVAEDGTEGVWRLRGKEFAATIADHARAHSFLHPGHSKVVAWRNVTVDGYNAMIRRVMFDDPPPSALPSERLLFTAPARDLENDPMASTDDEGVVERVAVVQHPLQPEFKVHRYSILLDTGGLVTAFVLHPESLLAYNNRREELAELARLDRWRWKDYWGFTEAFHQVRFAYAITAHRAQGSTYDETFVDCGDILLNGSRKEAFQCLYVACTRPRKRLFLSA